MSSARASKVRSVRQDVLNQYPFDVVPRQYLEIVELVVIDVVVGHVRSAACIFVDIPEEEFV